MILKGYDRLIDVVPAQIRFGDEFQLRVDPELVELVADAAD